MKKQERKALEAKLIVALNTVLQANKTKATDKLEKAVKKSAKKITGKIGKQKKAVTPKKAIKTV